jgi:hypothetical protein
MNQTLPPAQEHDPGDPEWLRQMRGHEDTPDWLRELIRSNQPEPEPPAAAGPAPDLAAAMAGVDAQEAASRELEHAADALEPSEELPEPEEADAQAAPSWLLDREEDDLEWLNIGEAQEPLAEGDETERDIPDWLQRMSPAAEAEVQEKSGAAQSAPPLAMEDQDLPDWLRDLSLAGEAEAAQEEELPDWLSELHQAPETDQEGERVEAVELPTAEEAEDEYEDEDEIPDWLMDLAEAPEGEPQGEVVAGPPQRQAPPEGMRPEEKAVQAPSAEAEPPPEAEPEAEQIAERPSDLDVPPLAEKEELPDWLVDMAEQELPEVPEAPPELEEGEPPSGPALPTIEDILGAAEAEEQPEIAEWLYTSEEPPAEEPILAFAEGELLQEEMPEWVDELRIAESEAAEQEPSVETSGPLAGLRGLINPDPLFGLTYKAAYSATPPVPDVVQEEARLLRQSLAAPTKRPDIAPVSPGLAALEGLGRWLIYAALLAAICVAMFVPAVQELIQTPRTVETEAFYRAVNGLPQGSEVLLLVDYDASHDGELTPQARAILWHLLNRDLGVIAVSHTPQGAAIVEDLIRAGTLRLPEETYVSGQDYLNLGYLPPHPASLQAFMASPLAGGTLWGAAQTEAAQTPLGQRAARFEDYELIIIVSSDQEHVRWWVEQAATRTSQARIVAGVSASVATYLLPYLAGAEGGQIAGLLVGLAGAAEYERLADAQFWPNARENLILLGSAQLLLAVIVLASGIRSVVGRSRGT